jgi:hypothetical protein
VEVTCDLNVSTACHCCKLDQHNVLLLLLLLLLLLQGCRPLSESVYSIDKVAGHSSVVLGLRDASGRQLSPVEALQQELQQVRVAHNML